MRRVVVQQRRTRTRTESGWCRTSSSSVLDADVHVLRLRRRPFCCPEVDSKADAVLLKQVLQRCADGQQIIKCHHINRRLWAVVPVLLLLFGVIEVWWLQRKIVPRHPHAATTLRSMLGTDPPRCWHHATILACSRGSSADG